MKQYFGFKMGSYWVYKNDSTGEIDSTYVRNFFDSDVPYSDKYRFELVSTIFHSKFLSAVEIHYSSCLANNIVKVTGKSDTVNIPDYAETGGPIAYFPGWSSNSQVITTDCLIGCIFVFKLISSDTINNKIYKNLIYSKTQSSDTNTLNSSYFFREIYFAKNIGIIKYFERNNYSNIVRSRSLIKYSVNQ